MSKSILLMYSNGVPSVNHVRKLKEIALDYDIEIANSEQEAINKAKECEIIIGHRYLRQCLPYAINLKYIQGSGRGFDRLPWKEIKRRKLLFGTTTFASKVIAQHAYMLAWSIIRGLPKCFELQREKQFDSSAALSSMLPWPKTSLILGFGSIGKELAKLLRSSNIKVWGVKRKLDYESKKYCDRLIDIHSWREILPEVDICFLALPLTDETRQIFDNDCLMSLPKHSIVINVGRGATLDVRSLVRVLRTGHLGGAALDVFDEIPKSVDSYIWNEPRLIITPYVAARYKERNQDFERFAEDQLYKYFNNITIENRVDWCGENS